MVIIGKDKEREEKKMKERIFAREVWSKPGKFYAGTKKPLLLFISYGEDLTETKIEKRLFVIIKGFENPLPFNKAYSVKPFHLKSWLQSNGWELVGHEYC